ncbi:MAG: hypothetical protein CMP07_14605 [Xanthomonadales bacterium]|nr:hypothetical protein [Xanthomonadales bacterium]|tara:strand:- start:1795 stop:5100 length:3306 start_codon:yes stop_codon:yes gene_type:complete
MKTLLIIGMHRSGTSAVARIVNMLGFNLGPSESMGEPSSDNPKGFWEQLPVRNLNDFLLRSVGATWDNPHSFAVDNLTERTRFNFFRLADRFVSRLRGDAPWAIKDPRLSLTMDAWRPLLQEPAVLFVYRNPIEVAGSLQARNNFPIRYGLALWEKYVVEALENSRGLPLVTVDYQDIVSDPVGTTGRLEKQLSEYFPGMLTAIPEDDLLKFIDPDLNHQRSSPDDTQLGVCLNERQRELVAALERAGAGDLREMSFKLSEESDRLLHAADDLRATERVLASGDLPAGEGRERETGDRDDPGGWVENVEQASGRFADFLPEAERLLESVGRAGEQVESFESRLALVERRMQAQEEVLEEQRYALEEMEKQLASDVSVQGEKQAAANSARRAYEAAGELQQLLSETRNSWRWKIGNAAVRLAEMLLLRGRPMLAVDAMDGGLTRLKTLLSEISAPNAVSPHNEADHILETDQLRILNEMPSSGRFDIVIFPIIDWHFRIQRPQHLARELAKRGHRVFYLTVTPRGGAVEPGFRLLEMPEPGVFVCELQVRRTKKFDLYGGKVWPEDVAEIRSALEALWRAHRIGESVSIVQHPSWCNVVTAIPANFLVYDCMDHHAGFSTHTPDVGRHERQLLKSSDLVVVTSEWLMNHHSDHGPRIIRNAAEIERFLPLSSVGAKANRETPVVGYIGTIAEWFDLRLIIQSARKYKDWRFVLVGSTAGCDTSEAERVPNIVFEGERPYSQVADYLKDFDVCVIPFKLNDLIKATNPVKVYEYLAAGKPVVAVRLPELEIMQDVIHLARDEAEWNDKLQVAMNETGDRELVERRSLWARDHSWASRAETLEAAVVQALPRVSVIILAYNNLAFSRACIRSVLKHTHYPDLEVIIVDNGSSDGSAEYFQEVCDEHRSFKLVRNEENLGFAGGNNIGMENASGEIVILLNNDTYVAPGWLFALVEKMAEPDGLDLAGPVTNNIGNEARIEISYGNMEGMIDAAVDYTWQHADEVLPVENLAFFCVAISRKVIDSIGLLDESFQGGFFEDDDYCRRAVEAGFKLGIVEDSFVHHHLSASFDQLGKQRKQEIFDANKAVYERKWGEWKPHSPRVQR